MTTDPIYTDAGATRTTGLEPDEGKGGQARQKAQEVGGQAREQSRQVAGTAKEQAGRVGQEAQTQVRDLMGQTTQQLRDQAQDQTQRLGGTLQSLAADMRALSEGRTDEAGAVGDYAHQAVERVQAFADQVEERGFDGLVDDVQRFARRRPGAFLLSAAVAGFAVGRLARGARDANADDSDPFASDTSPALSATTTGGALPGTAGQGIGSEFDRPGVVGTPGTVGTGVSRPAAPVVGPSGTGAGTGLGPDIDPLSTRAPLEGR